jgi:hypothetical protein
MAGGRLVWGGVAGITGERAEDVLELLRLLCCRTPFRRDG